MNKENKLVPELRFAEFKNEGEWDEKVVSQLAEYENGKAHEQDINVKGKYVVVNSKFISTDGEVRKYSNSANCIAQKDDILMVLSDVPNGRAIAKCFVVDRDNFYTVNQRICKLTPTNANSKILYYLLNRNAYFLNFDDGVKQTNLRNEDVLNCPLILPKNPKEQQKISSCLSSLDEVITAYSQKLDVLKEHKKGLMQNLFPSAGEKVPKYRFKEFENDGDWVETELENISSKIMVGIASAATHAYRNKGIILFRNQNIKVGYLDDKDILYIDEEYEREHKNKRLKAGDLLTARTGYPGTTCVVPEKYEGSQSFTTLITRPKHNIINSIFLSYYINSEQGQAFFNATKIGGGQQNVNAGSLAKMPIIYPSKMEQQKIAICLSSLDAIITVQEEKIEHLKLHKKGLMQGLFPKIID